MSSIGGLERRYRRLLLAYPGDYRRRHGAEIVTTLLEMAGPRQARPTGPDAWHLLVSGVRQRFRLPARRPLAWVAAVLITLIMGAFGAAAGSWCAERTFTRLPSDAAVAALTRQVAGGGEDLVTDRSPSPWTAATTWAAVTSPSWAAEAGRDRLAATGWQVTPVGDLPGGASSDGSGVLVPAKGSVFDAARGGLRIHVTGYSVQGHSTVTVGVWQSDTGALRPAVIVGGLLGMLAGWPVAAAAAYRMRRMPRGRRRAAVALSGLALVSLPLPACVFAVATALTLRPSAPVVYVVHHALRATLPYLSYDTRGLLPALTIAGLVLAASALAAIGRGAPPAGTADHVPAAG
jgi:hypothetical protein